MLSFSCVHHTKAKLCLILNNSFDDHKMNLNFLLQRPRIPSSQNLTRQPSPPSFAPNIGTTDKTAMAAPPKPRRMEPRTSLGQLINSEVLSDHFDHYGAPSMVKPAYDGNHNYTGRGRSSSNDFRYKPSTLDEGSIQATRVSTVEASRLPPSPASPSTSTFKAARPSSLARDDTYICKIENDVRKRLTDNKLPNKTQDDIALTSSAKKQQDRQNNLSQAISKQMGSLPDVTSLEGLASMPKEDLMKLSAARREEIKKLLEEQERRNAGDISVLASDVKVSNSICYLAGIDPINLSDALSSNISSSTRIVSLAK